jgi:hypothetical protein
MQDTTTVAREASRSLDQLHGRQENRPQDPDRIKADDFDALTATGGSKSATLTAPHVIGGHRVVDR